MSFNFKQLKNLPVYTRSGDFLGKINEIEINTETQAISKYLIKSSQVTKRLAGAGLMVSPSQVITIDDEKMVIEDSLIKEEKKLVNEPAAI